uniref:Solute carrier family 13 member 5 n=1 Tax=Steinernema glaseri TaxID=37863 RepID=A0A1I7ZZ13_9BILA
MTGSKPQWIMASFMGTTCFLSCWMDDCAATALMLPIAFATLESMNLDDEETGTATPVEGEAWSTVAVEHCDEPVKIPPHQEPAKEDRTIWKAMVLSCSYASLIGGTGTVIGTAPNLIFRDNVQRWYPHGETGVTYLSWMAFAVPPMVLYLFASWLTLQFVLIGPKKLLKMYSRQSEEDLRKAVRVKNSIARAYSQLGEITFAEKSVLFLYVTMILSWMSSDPGFMPGWKSLLGSRGEMISDSSVGIFIIFLMFVWPRERPSFAPQVSAEDS